MAASVTRGEETGIYERNDENGNPLRELDLKKKKV